MTTFKPKSTFKRGAEDGAWFGLFLSLLFFFSANALSIPLLGHIATLMALCVPVLTFFFLRKGYIQNGFYSTFSEIWTHGIIIFTCGSLIMALTIVIYTNWINPYFIIEQCNIAINAYRSMGDTGTEIAKTLEEVIKQKMLPSPISIATNIISFSVFSGSILSMILASIIKAIYKKRKNDNHLNKTSD